jgi:AraC-like DNA-binding protein
LLTWDNFRAVLSARTIVRQDGLEIADVACRHERGRGDPSETAGGHAVVLVRRGCFVRSADGVDAVLDPTLAYCINPWEEQRYDHPHEHGDDCTSLFLSPELVASLCGGEPVLPGGALPTSPQLDLEHRMLLVAARRGVDAHALVEAAIGLAARVLERVVPTRVDSGRPATVRARRALADAARELLAEDPDRTLTGLARELHVSPHHLSRIFRAQAGHTIARHRMRLRARTALERLAGGERDLGRLAFDLGFADQSHLCRVVEDETGEMPTALRRMLSASRDVH